MKNHKKIRPIKDLAELWKAMDQNSLIYLQSINRVLSIRFLRSWGATAQRKWILGSGIWIVRRKCNITRIKSVLSDALANI